MTDLVARVAAIAAKQRPDRRLAVIEQCPDLVAWLREWQDATGDKATLLRATVDGQEIYRA